MSSIKIKGYIVSVIDNKKIKIEINDEDSLNKMNNMIDKLKKNKNYRVPVDKECKNRFYITINNKTSYKFKNINYDNLLDLYGLEVFITFYHKYYSFNITSKKENEEEKEFYYVGYYFVASKITNISIFND